MKDEIIRLTKLVKQYKEHVLELEKRNFQLEKNKKLIKEILYDYSDKQTELKKICKN
ncbi:1370_t:CDS:1, partial [Dentiscutata heterogama]